MATYDFNFDLDKMNDRKWFSFWSKHTDFATALERGLKKGHQEVADRMVDKLIENLHSFGLNESDIINDIDVEITDDTISLILNGGSYGIFVEYGTGIVGKDNPHPMPSREGWIYDVNEHGESGWWYPSRENDRNAHKYITPDGRLLAWTKGQASRPFMYNTWRWTTSSATQIIDKNIKAEFRAMERKLK